jgi:uncharacterized protein (UPF0332 family)
LEEKEAYLDKGRESLACAESEFTARRYNTTARNIYYALFQGAVAALLQEGITPFGQWQHEFVHSRFSGQLVYRRKVYPAKFRRTLIEALMLRLKADYTPHNLTRRDVEGYLNECRELLRLIEERMQ